MKALIHKKKTLFQVSLKKYQNHPRIKLITTKNKSETFRFRANNTDEIKKFIEKIDPKEASQKSHRSTNILKNCSFFRQVHLR